MATPNESQASASGLLATIFQSFIASPLNIICTGICLGLAYLMYKRSSGQSDRESKSEHQRKLLKPLPKGDMTLAELRKYDGKTNDDGRLLLAVNREIYDVSTGWRFYGPDAPYAPLAGRDATRALALFAVDVVKDEWDDYSDLSVSQMNTVTEWLEQIKEKYEYVGRLVKTEAEKSTPVEPADEEPDEDTQET